MTRLFVSTVGLLQDHKSPDGHGNDQEAPGDELLPNGKRLREGLQPDVLQLLHLQQGWRGTSEPPVELFSDFDRPCVPRA